MTPERHVSHFSRDARSVAAARDWACKAADGFPRRDDLALVISELATNAQLHGGGELFGVVVETFTDGVCLTVTDTGTEGRPQLMPDPPPGELRVGGLGLRLVADLATTLTFEHIDGLTIVTATMTAQAPPENDTETAEPASEAP